MKGGNQQLLSGSANDPTEDETETPKIPVREIRDTKSFKSITERGQLKGILLYYYCCKTQNNFIVL